MPLCFSHRDDFAKLTDNKLPSPVTGFSHMFYRKNVAKASTSYIMPVRWLKHNGNKETQNHQQDETYWNLNH